MTAVGAARELNALAWFVSRIATFRELQAMGLKESRARATQSRLRPMLNCSFRSGEGILAMSPAN
jgi:hypothetical protein